MKKLILLLISGFFFSCQTDVDHNSLFTFENFNPKLINKNSITEGEIAEIKINIDSANLKPNYKTGVLNYTLKIRSDLNTKYLINGYQSDTIKNTPNTYIYKYLIQGENIVSFVVPKPRKEETNINLTLANNKEFEISKNILFLIQENENLTVTQKVIKEKDNETNEEVEKNILQIDIKKFKKKDKYAITIDPMELKGSFEKDNESLENNTFEVQKKVEEIEYKPNDNDKDEVGLHLIKITLKKKENINKDKSIDYYFYFKIEKPKNTTNNK